MTTPSLNDCFTASGVRMTVAEAMAQFSEKLVPIVGVEQVATRAAAGRILAENMISSRTVPPADNAAVDGYAVRFDDLIEGETTSLPVAETIAAGHPLGKAAEPGKAYRIFTGAPVPSGPDTIFMLEDCESDGSTVSLPAGLKRGANLRRAGEDVQVGDKILERGTRLRPQEVGMAASLGFDRLPVFRRLKVAVFSTGDEVRDPGQTLDDGCIYDINRYTLLSMLDGLGCEVTDLGIFPDRFEAVRDGIAAAAGSHDLVITSGGVSMGDEDHIKSAIQELGAVNFWNLAIKPGRPIALGVITKDDRETPFIGLPGNPVATMVTFLLIARPIIMRLSGSDATGPALFKVPAQFELRKKAGRREWLRARLEPDGDGRLTAVKYPEEGSGILTSMVQSDGLVELPEDCLEVKKGQLVDFLPFSEVMR